jgi:hypothetical protein
MSYLSCLLAHSCVQHILCCVLLCPTHIVFYCVQHILCCVLLCPTHIVLCFVVSNTYCFVFCCVQHILRCVLFGFLRLVYPVLPVSLDCPLLLAPLVFSNVYSLIDGCC